MTTMLLRVLLIEDSEDDALLTLRELRKGGFQVEWERLDTKPAMERALAERVWDLVICDHMMPAFSSVGALDVLRKRALDLPFIIVSGAAPEDLVTAAMRQGAHDFLSKGNLVRLVPAVQRELKEAALRRDREQIASRLAVSEERTGILAAAVEQVVDAVAITDPQGNVIYANRAFGTLIGFTLPQIQGCALGALLDELEVDLAVRRAAQGGTWEGRLALRLEGRNRQEVDATFSPLRDEGQALRHLVVVLRDVTKEVELERELRQSHKMDALGQLAAGIAHDFNNLLTTILASAELIKYQAPAGSPLLPKVEAIMHAGLCAAGLTKQILGFSRKSDDRRLPLDLTVIVRDTLHTLEGSIPANIELRHDLSSGIWVEGDPALLQQVVMNLAINALQAMRPEGGLLSVALAEKLEERRSGPGAERFAVLTVRDTGCGMDAEVQERLFEPFFTTKPAGEGTGLGLAMVHATVAKAGGRINLRSAPGQGTTFKVHLPCAKGQAAPLGQSGPAAAGAAASPELAGTESVMFVDDDELMAMIAKQGLQSLGYRVAAFTSAGAALEAFRLAPDQYDLVFTDLVMPGLGGIELGQELQAVRPGLPMVLVTGASTTSALSLSAHATFKGIVTKPFTKSDLAVALRKGLLSQAVAELPVRAAGPASLPARGQEPALAQGGKPRILLAEDSQTTRAMIRTWLERAGYAVQEAKDGLEAWELFGRTSHGDAFDLLLTDVVMPRMDGLELVQLVRKADPVLPVAVLTSNEDKETVKSALHLGVNEFLNKPFERADLLECVKSLLAERSSRIDVRRSQETAQAVRLAQRSMLAAPEKGVPLFTLYEPLTDAGGDLFRCFRCADGSILFAIADVAGHSVISSYAVAAFLGLLSSYVGECFELMALAPNREEGDTGMLCDEQGCGRFGQVPCDPLPHLAAKLNRGIQAGPFAEVPVCTLLGQWTPGTGRLRLLNAGIPHGLLCRRSAQATEPIRLNGTPLGVFPEPDLEGVLLQLEPGDRFLFGTDGFFEVRSPDHRFFEDSAPQHWQALASSPLDWALSVVCEAARSHGGGVINDDLLVVGFEQPSLEQVPEELTLRLPSTARAVDMACDRLHAWLRAAGSGWSVGQGRRFDVVLAVREALINAVFHGNRNRPEAFVSLRCRPEGNALVASVADEGPGFDLAGHQAPEDPLSERGRGVPLIRHHAQQVRMDGNAMTMTFDLEESDHDEQ